MSGKSVEVAADEVVGDVVVADCPAAIGVVVLAAILAEARKPDECLPVEEHNDVTITFEQPSSI